MAPDLLPRSVLSAPEKARRRVALLAGVATGAAALAGLWIRFEDGAAFRLGLAATSALFGWLAMEGALGAKDASMAAMRALGISIALGALSTLWPACILAAREERLAMLLLYVPFGAVWGGLTGFAYGIVLAILAALTWNRVASATHEGADGAVRIASAWAVLPLALIAFVLLRFDLPAELHEWSTEREVAAHRIAVPFGVLAVGVVLNAGLYSCYVASRRAARRARWLAHVASGLDPRWRVREIEPFENVDALPRLRQGVAVLEHHPDHAIYRSNATGEAVAII